MSLTEQVTGATTPSGESREVQLVGVGPHEKTKK